MPQPKTTAAAPAAPAAPATKKTITTKQIKEMVTTAVTAALAPVNEKVAALEQENAQLKTNGAGTPVGVGQAFYGVAPVERGAQHPYILVTPNAPPERKGINAARHLLCMAQSRYLMAKQGRYVEPVKLAEKAYGGNHPVTKALSPSSSDAIGLMPEGFTSEIVPELKAKAVFFDFEPQVSLMIGGKLKVGAVRSGATAHWVGRGPLRQQTPQVSNIKTGKPEEDARKLEILCPVDNDVIRFTLGQNSPVSPLGGKSAEEIILDNMMQTGALAMDIAFFRALGEQAQVKGLRAWVPAENQLTAEGANDLNGVTDDLERIRLRLQSANSLFIRPGMATAPTATSFLRKLRDGNGNRVYKDEIEKGTLEGFKHRTCNQFPTNLGDTGDLSEIIAADFSDVYVGDGGQMEVASSQEATYTDELGNQVNAFTEDTTLLKILYQTALLVVHEGNVVVMQVPWAPGLA